MNDWQVSIVIINFLLFGGFLVTAYETFKRHNPFAAVAMLVNLLCIIAVNGV